MSPEEQALEQRMTRLETEVARLEKEQILDERLRRVEVVLAALAKHLGVQP